MGLMLKVFQRPRNLLAVLTVLMLSASATAQDPSPSSEPAAQSPAPETQPPSARETDSDSSRQRPETSKTIAEKAHTASLERRLINRLIADQKDIWTSPFHTSRADAKWWLILGGGTAALIPADHWLATQLPNTADQLRFAGRLSNVGGPFMTYAMAGGFYLGGKLSGNPRAIETGILGAEALTNSLAVVQVFKLITQRERPEKNNAKGRFFVGGTSFPSGHEIMSWSLATIVASEYADLRIVQVGAYGLATIVGAARFAARKHFASDVLAGAAMGWFIGRHVYNRWATEPKHGSRAKTSMWKPHIEPEVGFGSCALALRWGQ